VKDKLGSAQKVKEQLETYRNELAQAQRRGEYQRAGELTYSLIPELERKLAQQRKKRARSSMKRLWPIISLK